MPEKWSNKHWRLGLKLGPDHIGWAGVEVEPDPSNPGNFRTKGPLWAPPMPFTHNEQFSPKATFDDKVAHAIRMYSMLLREYGEAEIYIKRYAPSMFHRSRAAREGGTRDEYYRLIDAVARRLAEQGVKVVIEEVRQMSTFKYALGVCGLSQQEASEFLQIKLQSVKNMSAGRVPVPDGVWELLANLFEQIQDAADNAAGVMATEGIDDRSYNDITADIPGNELPNEGAAGAAGAMALLMAIQDRISAEA